MNSSHLRTRPIGCVAKKLSRKIRFRPPAFISLVVILAFAGLHAPLANAQANVQGTWQTLPQLMPINPIHTALMWNGKILIVSGSGNYPPQTTYMVGVWDPSNNSFTSQTQSWDQFCNSIAVFPDGRPFIVGGTLQYDPFHGYNRTTVYDPATGNFTDVENMAHGRWYPTNTILPDGRLMTFSGLDENGATNPEVEIYKVGAGWSAPYTAPWTPDLYPRMHVLPNGTVFYSGSLTQSRTFNPANNTWSGVIATTNYSGVRTYGSSVLFPLTPANGYKPKVIIFGGGNPATATTETIDLSVSNPSWTYGPSMSQPRIEMNATLLPNGKILTVGGSLNDEDTSTASLQADLYDTATNTMGSAGSNAYPRLYHSVAVLLPDATVWVAGGNPTRGSYQEQVEIYTPPYLYNSSGSLATRPTITSVSPSVIGYGTSFQVQTPNAANISSVVIMRASATTHAFNTDQRLVGLTFSSGSGVLNITGPPNGNIAPPGYYLVFLINNSGVPSVAKFVQVSATPTDTPPKGTITSPASNITIAPGQSVNFAGTGSASSGSISGYSWSMRGGSPNTSNLANPGSVTFSTAGVYTVEFTVTDSAGNTDPSPPTRTITVASEPAPVLSSVSPNSAKQGQTNLTVTLTGSNFLSSPSCSFGAGTTVNSCTYNSSTQITASINVLTSATTGTRNVIVTNTDGQSSTLTNGFTINAGTGNPAPTITSISPNTGVQGQSNISVTITGKNFLSGPACDFDSDEGLTVTACTYKSSTTIAATLSISSTAVLGGHDVVITDTDGQSATSVNGFTVTSSSGGGGISFGSGFTSGSMLLNGSSTISGTSLTVTPNSSFIAGSAWFPTPVNIQSFTTDFSFQQTAGTNTADGMTFTIQNAGTTAMGGTGGNLGYGGMGTSVAVKFDLYSNSGEGPDSTGLYLNGASPTTPAVDMTSSGINLHSGDVLKVHMTYDGTNLAMTVTDATTSKTFSQTWAVNIPSTVAGNTAYVGFTGATGGYTAQQQVLTWTMTSGSGSGTVATPMFSPGAGTYLGTQTVMLSDTTSGSTIFYTTDGTQPGTSVGGSTKQYSSAISVTATETIKALATASGQTTSPTASATYTIESQLAQPTFMPGGGSYSSAQNVSISGPSGSTIYYTTDGSMPSTGSTKYGGAISVSSSETLNAIAAETGYFSSNEATAVYTIGSGGGSGINFGSGFTSGSMALNGNASISGGSLTITQNTTAQVSSAWFPTAINIQNFTTDFTFQQSAGTNTADGLTFTLQGDSTTALGGTGGNLGYEGLAKSVAVKFDLYNNNGEGPDSTGLYVNGASPTTPAVDMTSSGVNLHSGDVFKVHMNYDGTTLTMTITDATTAASFTQAWTVNIPGTIGANTAYAGFTGATGGYSALQQILTWTMTSGNATGTVATPTFSPAAGSYSSGQNVMISSTSGATIYYTTNGNAPTTGSTKYVSPVSVSSSETLKALAVAGSTDSAVGSASYTIGTAPVINYPSGFASGNIAFNGNSGMDGTKVLLTDTNNYDEAGSAWFNTPVNVQNFTTDFTFQQSTATNTADGLTFTIQGNSTTALGGSGGNLGVGTMGNSVAVKFDLYSNDGEGPDSTGMYLDGASPTTPAEDMTSSGVNLHSGDVFKVHITYDGTTLTMTITDTTTTTDTFTQSWPVNIPGTVGGNTAYVGFTGGTGGYTSKQEVLTWTYTVN